MTREVCQDKSEEDPSWKQRIQLTNSRDGFGASVLIYGNTTPIPSTNGLSGWGDVTARVESHK